ncbi:MAG: PorP/SprF family type IX secretion system membrane protein [Bacteroidetes bacterium]|nr:PorP/SprF family type IX secretion system membrane protein [Bacteroidota bacterium]
MIHYKTIAILIFTFTIAGTVASQDLHFSQFFNTPLTTNPANTGFIPDADYRLGVNYRNQWSNIMSAPYKTMSAFGDAQLLRNKLENGWVGIGAVLLSDVAGSGNLRSTKGYVSIAYHQMLGNSSLLSGGFNLGYANKRIDLANLKFPSQFDGKFFDGTIIDGNYPNFANTNISYFDMQVGMNYAYFPQENVYINAGYSIHHVNSPRESFFNNQTNAGKIPIRHIGFVNAILKVDPRVIINPNIYFTTQAGAVELMGGMNANYNLSESGQMQLVGGLYYRYKDAVIPMVGLEVNDIKFTFSYDATLSSLNNFNNYRGAFEFSLIKNGFYPDNVNRQSLCPKF